MPDIFQFYSQSADAAPGKGAGEELSSPPETYAELRKQKGWRRILADKSEDYENILVLTKDAQLWQAFPKKPRIRREDLETKREELKIRREETQKTEVQRLVEPAPEMEAEKKTRKTKPNEKEEKKEKTKAKKTEITGATVIPGVTGITEAPEGGIMSFSSSAPSESSGTAAVAPEPLLLPPSDLETPEEVSSIRFCPHCRYYLYLQNTFDEEERVNYLERLCRNCGYRERDMKGGLVSEISIKEQSTESYRILINEFTKEDYRLPRIRGSLKCPNGDCASNHGTESEILYLKYDPVNISYIYICSHCNTNWRSRR